MDDLVSQKVNGPSIGLILVGALGALYSLAMVGMQGFGLVGTLMGGEFDIVSLAMGTGFQFLWALVGLVAGVVIILGGVRMRQQRSVGMVYAAAAASILPCCAGPCCCLGIPIGIWALVTLNDEDVKAAFEAA